MLPQTNVFFQKPAIDVLSANGYRAVDMHCHTQFSDSFTKVTAILKRAYEMGIGVAITDHNEIRGALKASRLNPGILIIPGIEISTAEGPHILAYFETIEALIHFYIKTVKPAKNINPHSNTRLTLPELLRALGNYDALISLAHPYSPAYTNVPRNIDNGYIKQQDVNKIDAIEAMNGAMNRYANHQAVIYADDLHKPVTGGSDSHSLYEFGTVVTYARARTPKDFLNAIRQNRNGIMGKPMGPVKRMPSHIKAVGKHMVYFFPDLPMRYENLVMRPVRNRLPEVEARIRRIRTGSMDKLTASWKTPRKAAGRPLDIVINGKLRIRNKI